MVCTLVPPQSHRTHLSNLSLHVAEVTPGSFAECALLCSECPLL